MKYCADFYGKEVEFLNEVDEINLNLSKIKDLADLDQFCKNHINQRINLCINDLEDAINKKYFIYAFDFQKHYPQYNVIIRLPHYDNWSDKIKNDYPNAKFYFNVPISNWDTLLFYLKYRVTDVYISEAMGFELEDIVKKVHEYNSQVRVFPNIAQAAEETTEGYLKFWIRPEDIEFYEDYIDVCELFYDKYEQQEIYFNIYKKDKKWTGDLNEIIFNLNCKIDNTRIVPRFAKKRVRCNRQCMKDKKCKLCERIIELSETLSKTPIRIITEEDRTWQEDKN